MCCIFFYIEHITWMHCLVFLLLFFFNTFSWVQAKSHSVAKRDQPQPRQPVCGHFKTQSILLIFLNGWCANLSISHMISIFGCMLQLIKMYDLLLKLRLPQEKYTDEWQMSTLLAKMGLLLIKKMHIHFLYNIAHNKVHKGMCKNQDLLKPPPTSSAHSYDYQSS